MPGEDDQTTDAVEPTLPGEDASGAAAEGRSHRGEPLGLRERLVAARYRIAGAFLVVVLAGAALAAGVGPGDGLRGGPSAQPRGEAPPGIPETPDDTATPEPADPGSTVGLSYLGLCRAFQTELATNEDAADDPAFDDLADDAGGESKVEKYCVDLLGDASATVTATPTATPTTQPTAAPTTTSGSNPKPRPTSTATSTAQPSPTPTATTPGPPDPTATATDPGGKPTKTPRP